MDKKAFTFIELAITVTMVLILATIWIVSYVSFIWDSRDTNRLQDITNIYRALDSFKLKSVLPFPELSVELRWNWEIYANQWYVWETIFNEIWYKWSWKDPITWKYYTYLLSKNLKSFQLLVLLEKSNVKDVSFDFIKKAKASEYEDKFPRVFWDKMWVILTLENIPIQETNFWVDVFTTTESYKAIIDNNFYVFGSSNVLKFLADWAWKSCENLFDKAQWKWLITKKYFVNSDWLNSIEVCCDMKNGVQTDIWNCN